MLRSNSHPTFATIESALQDRGLKFKRRTIQRDMSVLERKVDADIESLPTKPSRDGGSKEYYYFYDRTPGDLGDVLIENDDLLAVSLAREMLRHTIGSPASDSLKRTYDKILGLADDKIRKVASTGVPIAFAGGMNTPVNPDIWNAVLKAIREKKTIRVTYLSGWEKKSRKTRSIEPYYIVNLSGEWYLIGSAGTADPQIHQYKLSRFKNVMDAGSHATMNNDFNIDAYLENVFGRFIGDPQNLVDIKIRFKKRIAPLVLEQRFHRKEKKTVKNDGDLIIEFPVTPSGSWPFYHVISWILSWGSDAKVLAPPELKKLVANECRKMTKELSIE
jgi:predicted DNA-binding transcriptional regulator YafY